MNARDVERELAVVLHRHAEDAMRRTDTHEEHEKFQAEVAGRSRRDVRRWTVGGVAAVGVAAVTAVILWSADPGDHDDSAPARGSQTTEEELAQNFVEAVAAGDNDRVRSYLTGPALDGWRGESSFTEAWSRTYLLKPCVETSTSLAATTVSCPFDMHMLHSEQLGLGPFTGNAFTIQVKDGRIVSAEEFTASGPDSGSELFLAIGAWVRDNHPGKWQFMSSPEGHTPSEMERWYRLWEVYSQEYADEMTQEGGASAE